MAGVVFSSQERQKAAPATGEKLDAVIFT